MPVASDDGHFTTITRISDVLLVTHCRHIAQNFCQFYGTRSVMNNDQWSIVICSIARFRKNARFRNREPDYPVAIIRISEPGFYRAASVHGGLCRKRPLLLQQTSSELWWLSKGNNLGGRLSEVQNSYCTVLYCVLKLCTVISTFRFAVHWAHFTVRRFICVYVSVFCGFVKCCFYIIVTRWGGPAIIFIY